MKRLCILIFLILICFNQLLAPNLSEQLTEQKNENISFILKLNDVLKEKYNYYPKIDTSYVYSDIEFMRETIHRMLMVEAMCDQEVGLTFNEYVYLPIQLKKKLAFNSKEQAVGLLQIRPIMHRQLVYVLQLCDYKLFTRWNAEHSIDMFILFQNYYNPTWDLEKGSRDWNGGGDLGMKKHATLKYYLSVKEKYNVLVKKFLI